MKSIHKLKAIFGANREVMTRKIVKSLVILASYKSKRDPSKPKR